MLFASAIVTDATESKREGKERGREMEGGKKVQRDNVEERKEGRKERGTEVSRERGRKVGAK